MNKRLQSSLEFMIIFGFLIFVIFGILFIVSYYSEKIQNDIKQKENEDFMNMVVSNIKLVSSLEKGFVKKINITNASLEKYNITINETFLIITTKDVDNSSFNQIYYEYPQNIVVDKTLGENLILEIYKN